MLQRSIVNNWLNTFDSSVYATRSVGWLQLSSGVKKIINSNHEFYSACLHIFRGCICAAVTEEAIGLISICLHCAVACNCHVDTRLNDEDVLNDCLISSTFAAVVYINQLPVLLPAVLASPTKIVVYWALQETKSISQLRLRHDDKHEDKWS
jgi:hypothetical protein